MYITHAILVLFLALRKADGAACNSCVNSKSVPSSYAVKTYHDSSEFVENPHRGFVDQLITHSSHHSALTMSKLDGMRHDKGITMALRTFVIDTFVTSSISDDYLNKIRHDLDTLMSAGFTTALRFCYIFSQRHSHPLGDAKKDIVLHHISQLKPIFQKYKGVITSIQAGFIGAWGEWHTTEYFGSPEWNTAGHDPVTGLMPQAYRDRKDILMALLHAAPKSIQIQLRYPAQKMHMMGSTPATFQGVQRGDDNARTGHHNDCFLSSEHDVGTYHNTAVEYPYLAKDTRYTIIGGETCSVANNHRSECPTALKEMAMFHWTYLNEGFDRDVYSLWKHQGCYNDVHRRLGYRLSIAKAILPKSVHVGDDLCFHLEFTNHGFAAPVKHFNLHLILASTSGSHHYAAQVTGVDVRDWQPGYTHTVASSVHVHAPEGHYKVLVSLSDPVLGDRADYNVLLATTGVPLYTQGLNDLGHTVTVSGQHASSSGCPGLYSWKPPAAGHYSRLFKG
ncbi:uncharacterized protein [Littorina saxatilis]|uniref:DUF4832 domain-containing protein n=1 Tax=Littorina saxatilis TaxID=31220 RepID=A0AAN9C1G8_9CAEN